MPFNRPYPWILAGAGVIDILGVPDGSCKYTATVWGLEQNPVIAVRPVNHPGVRVSKSIWRGTNAILSWSWAGCEGNKAKVEVYSDQAQVELLLNGRSLGRKQNDRSNPKVRNQIHWDKFTYEPGTIEAVGRNAGKVVARHRVETAGEAVALRLVPDLTLQELSTPWRADGIDLQHVTVEAVDKKGRVVPTANHDVSFTLHVEPAKKSSSLTGSTGSGTEPSLVAVSSGDHYSDELTQTNHRRLFEGHALAILRAGSQPATITLTAAAPGLKPAKLKLSTQ
jgi:hypothetical protein